MSLLSLVWLPGRRVSIEVISPADAACSEPPEAVNSDQAYSEAEASSAMKRMLQHHATNGWGDDIAQPANVPAPAQASQSAAAGTAAACDTLCCSSMRATYYGSITTTATSGPYLEGSGCPRSAVCIALDTSR